MTEAYLMVILLTYVGFAAVFLFLGHCDRHQRFVRCFAFAWLIEALRVSVLWLQTRGVSIPESVFVGQDLLYLVVTWLLLAGTLEFIGPVRRAGSWGLLYLVSGAFLLLAATYAFPPQLAEILQLTGEQSRFWSTLAKFTFMFVPGGLIRLSMSAMFFRYWKRTHVWGALIAALFSLPHAAGSLVLPLQWYFSYFPPGAHLFWFIQILGFSVGSLALVFNRQYARLERTNAELKKALQKVRTLRGLLPICAACKKVRDDSGYWQEIEQYLYQHSEAELSHGLCPQCTQTLYPDFPSHSDPPPAPASTGTDPRQTDPGRYPI